MNLSEIILFVGIAYGILLCPLSIGAIWIYNNRIGEKN